MGVFTYAKRTVYNYLFHSDVLYITMQGKLPFATFMMLQL